MAGYTRAMRNEEKITEYLLQGIKLKNGRYKNNNNGSSPRSGGEPVHNSELPRKDARDGHTGPIRVIDGIYLPLGFPFTQGGK